MKYSRWILLAGILFLAAGGAARLNGAVFAPFLFSAGGLCKITYLLILIKSGRYRPGYELLFLITGLSLLYAGIIIRRYPDYTGYSSYLIAFAILFKLIFAVIAIKKIRSDKMTRSLIITDS